jgi:phosphatidylglycerol---prolipoprotein diacylglyceryl transferase
MQLYFVWDPMKEIIRGIQPPVWYSVLFALGFIISYQLVTHFFKTEGKKTENVDTLTVYMVLATIIGARFGHLAFYEPERFLADPLMFFRTWEGGLASHGGAFGILIAIMLYRNYEVDASWSPFKFKFRKHKREGQSYYWIIDRLVIATAITAAFIRFGNFVNSEIVGKPTDSEYGVVYGRVAEEYLQNSNLGIQSVEASKGDRTERLQPGIVPVDLKITFEGKNTTEQAVRQKVETSVKDYLTRYPAIREHYAEPVGTPINYVISTEKRQLVATVQTYGIVRHPAQLYEAGTSILLFLILLGIWYKYKEKTPEGLLFGIFMIWIFGLRWFHEGYKENQVAFEDGMTFNMGQLLSIPLILLGVVVLIRAYIIHKKSKAIT